MSLHTQLSSFRNSSTGTSNHATMQPLSDEELRHYAPSIFTGSSSYDRSSRYVHIPTSAIITGMRSEGFLPVAARQAKSRDVAKVDHTKHIVRFRREGHEGTYRNEEAMPEVVLVNSHDGSSSYQLFGGLFRTLCLNGLIVSESLINSVRVAHKGDIQGQVIEGAYRVLGETSKAMKAYKSWQAMELLPAERMAFAEAAHTLRFPLRHEETGEPLTAIKAEQLLTTRRHVDASPNLWATFNVVQENCIAGGLTAYAARKEGQRRGRRVTTRAIGEIDQDVTLNRALWTLAEKMAEIKATC